MSSFNEFRSLVFIRFNALAPLSGQALVTGKVWATVANFTRFGNIALNEEMLHNLVSNHSVGVFPGCGVVVIGHSVFRSCATNLKCSHSLEGFNIHILCDTKVICKCGYMVHPICLEISGFLCRETLQIEY